MKRNYYKSTLGLLIFVCFIGFGFGGEKRDRDDAESSTARENKSARYQTDLASSLQTSSDRRIEDAIAYKKPSLLNLFEWIDKFEFECAPRTLTELLNLKDEIPEAKITKYLKSCDEQAKRWLDEKIERFGSIGGLIARWFKAIASSLKGDVDLVMEENVRVVGHLANKLTNICRILDKNFYGIELIENSRRAYYLGDGICVHMLASPFNKIEEFMKVVLREFGSLRQYVKDVKGATFTHASITIYTFQKICRRFHDRPRIPDRHLKGVNTSLIFSKDSAREAFKKNLKEIRASIEDRGYNCEWSTLFNHKLLYHFLGLFREKGEIEDLKKIADDATDALVWHCLSALGSTEEEFKIFDTIRGKSDEDLFPALLELMSKTFKSYTLKPDQSINDALDIRAPSNGFRKSLMTEIEKLLTDSNSNVRLANYFIDLLLGHLDLFQKNIFKRHYKQEIVSFELPEFLFHVFSIKGYKPKFSSPLFDFYYLQTVAEICNMIPIDISKIISSRLASKRQNSDQAGASTSTTVVAQTTDMVALEKIFTFDTVCNFEALHELSNFTNEAADSFLNKCDSQARKWLEKKTKKIDTFGLMMKRWMKSIDHYIEEIRNEIESMSPEGIGGDKRLVGKLRCSLERKKLTDMKIIDNKAEESTRLALNYGDGICVHILSPPFDRVENFMEVVMSRFKHLNYIKKVRTTGHATAGLEIYIFQKFCRLRYMEPTQMLSQRVIRLVYPIDRSLITNYLKHFTANIQLEREDRFSCDSIEVFNFKQGYRILRLSPNNASVIQFFKRIFDDLMDRRVKICLLKFANEGAGRIYSKTISTSTQAMLPALLDTLSKAIKSYQLPPDQSINSALDIRSSNNGFKQILMTQIKDEIIQSSNKELVKLLTNLLKGHFTDEIFSDKIYENKQLVEFLFQVFDIEGYKSQLSSPLLGVYYLYKISEICDMIPVDGLSFKGSSNRSD